MSRYGKAVYACDYAGFDKQDWGYYTRGKMVKCIWWYSINHIVNV